VCDIVKADGYVTPTLKEIGESIMYVGAHQIPPVPTKYASPLSPDAANLLLLAPVTNSLMLAAVQPNG